MQSVNRRLPFVAGAIAAALVAVAGAGADDIRSQWRPTNDMITARSSATLTPLPDGRVLAAGGYTNGTYTRRTEIYDPQSATWSPAPDLQQARGVHSATLLPNAAVLVAGGWGTTAVNRGILDGIERFTVKEAAWSTAGKMTVPRYQHMAVLLLDGRVLLAGGCSQRSCAAVEASAEIYDPSTGASSPVAPMTTRRHGATATLLPNGKVLVAGGSASSSGGYLATAELFDPSTGTWTATGSMMAARSLHTALRVSATRRGAVLVAGGFAAPDVLAGAEVYDPWTGLWTPTADMIEARAAHTMTRLTNGRLLVAGGIGTNGTAYLTSAEEYDPMDGHWYSAGDMNTPRINHAAALLANGIVLVAGGHTAPGTIPASASSELYVPLVRYMPLALAMPLGY
jgi:hypothetical protein